MRLTSFTNYSLRALQLAALRSPDLVQVEDVVKIHRVARPHIAKAVYVLGREGYLETLRGRSGGFTLGRPAQEITVGEIVRLTEGPLEVVECFNPDTNSCPLIGICRLSQAIREATGAFMTVLDDLTIADIASNRAQILDRIAPLQAPAGKPPGRL